MLSSSLTVWPSSKSIAEEISIPLLIDFHPFDKDSNLPHISIPTLPRCESCHSFLTVDFQHLTEKPGCPFCGFSTPFCELPSAFSWHSESFQTSFFFFIVLDLRMAVDIFSFSKRLILCALRSIPPGQKFLLIFVENEIFSIVTVFDTGLKLLNFPVNVPIGDRFSLEIFLNDWSNIELLSELISETIPSNESCEVKQLNLKVFCRKDSGICHFVIFSPHIFESQKQVLITLISPIPIINRNSFEGIVIAPNLTEDLELQIKLLIER
jgi:hypothetical protein